jgi:hypothetical protein
MYWCASASVTGKQRGEPGDRYRHYVDCFDIAFHVRVFPIIAKSGPIGAAVPVRDAVPDPRGHGHCLG